MRKAPDLLNSLCSASAFIECHKTGLQEMGGRLPWGLNVVVTSREESMAAGSLWFLGGYLSYWERRSLGGPCKSVVEPNIQHPFRDFPAIIFICKSTEAFESVAGRWSSVLGEVEKRVMLIHLPLLETENFTSASMAKGRAPAAVLWLWEEEFFPVSSARLLSQSICKTWKLL